MRRTTAAPKEVWLYRFNDGSWTLSFDAPTKRNARRWHRMVPGSASEAKRLRRALLAVRPCLRYFSDLGTAEMRRRNAETIVTAALARQPVKR